MKQLWKSTRGTSMVEVLVAFAVLVLIMGIFSQALSLAGNMLGRSDHTLENSHQLAGNYYQDIGGDASFHEDDLKDWRFEGKYGSFTVKARHRAYTDPDGRGVIHDLVPEIKAD